MVNPLLILPLLNSSLSASAECWHQNPRSEPQLIPLDYKQCREVIPEINAYIGKEERTPLTFGRSPGVGFEVPKTWDYGSCHVTIDMVRPDVTETTTFATILIEAFGLNLACVLNPPSFGGKAFVGDHHLIEVSIHGSDTGMARRPFIVGLR